MSNLPVQFGLVVKQLREELGVSQEQLAARAELNRTYVGEVERAKAMPSLATIEKIARAFGLPVSQLLSRCEHTSNS
jgi:transcriptional regulator with XRE-family HTH domain